MPLKIAYLTICTANYLANALTLATSLDRAEPGAHIYVFVVDGQHVRKAPPPMPPGARIDLINVGDLGIEAFLEMAFRYDALALCCALKPLCIGHVLDVLKHDAAVYLDSDIRVYHALDHVLRALDDGAACVLTPHITKGLQDDRIPGEDIFLTTGMFNMGFAAFRNTPSSRDFIEWWQQKTRSQCIVDLSRGLLHDQTYGNFAPCFIPEFVALQHSAYNVAYWNLPHRTVTKRVDCFFVDDEPLRFFHFSGLDTKDPTSLSKHQNRYTRSSIEAVGDLVDHYVHELDQRDQHDGGRYSDMLYPFAFLRDGRPIDDQIRAAYDELKQSLPANHSPFDLDLKTGSLWPIDRTRRFLLNLLRQRS